MSVLWAKRGWVRLGLLGSATAYLNGVTPFHYADYITNRMLYAGADVGTVAGGTGYSFTRASDGYYTNSDGTLTLFGSGALRRGDRGVLIEGSRTNLLLRSQEFDNAVWLKTEVTTTANTTEAPDGTTTADSIIETTANALHRIQQAQTVTLSQAASATVFVKPVGSRRLYVNAKHLMDAGALFDFSGSGSVIAIDGPAGNLSASILALANNWYRVTLTGTGTGTATALLFQIATSAHSAALDETYTGDGTSGFILWGAQLEAAAFPSSYIPTVAAAATRAADVLTYTAGVTYPLGPWIEWEHLANQSVTQVLMGLYATTNNDNRTNLLVRVTPSNNARYLVASAAATQADIDVGSALALNTVHKLAGRTSANSVQVAINGTLGTEDTSVTVPSAPTIWSIGCEPVANQGQPFGYIRRAAVFNSALTNAQLQTTTS